MLQQVGLLALAGAMVMTLYEMGVALRPSTCAPPPCAGCCAWAAPAAHTIAAARNNRQSLSPTPATKHLPTVGGIETKQAFSDVSRLRTENANGQN